jgi:hypothetical protein
VTTFFLALQQMYVTFVIFFRGAPCVNLLAAKAKTGPGAETTETGLDNKSAVAFEKHRIRLRMAAGAWRDCPWTATTMNLFTIYIHARARLPFVHSCTADAAVQEDLRRADERQERAARNLVQSFTFGAPGVGTATHEAGGTPLGPPGPTPRGPGDAQGVAQQRRCLLNTSPPPPSTSQSARLPAPLLFAGRAVQVADLPSGRWT